MDLPLPPGAFWGKLFPRKAPFLQWHGLDAHCADVAAVAEALLGVPLIHRRLAALAQVEALPAVWLSRLCVLAFLHDFGKANHQFQDGVGGHIAEAVPVAADAGRRAEAGLDAIAGWAREGRHLLSVILGHHGQPPDLEAGRPFAPLWAARAARDPMEGVRQLVDAARHGWPDAFAAGGPALPDLEEQAPFWHFYLGLLQLADWLGSDSAEDAFPFSRDGEGPRLAFARERARVICGRLGLDPDALRAALPAELGFSRVSPHAPTELQSLVAELPGPVVVLEAETGSGKTEAALWRFARLFQAGRVDGLYFALPTRVAATAMHARVQAACDRLFGAGAVEVVRALPGDAAAGAASVRLLPDFGAQWTDDPDEARKRARWAAEGPKRFLAASVAVGTTDQALLGTIRVKHAQMRSFCLSRGLLVVDEVHASDTYMSVLLERLLEQHASAGGEALLLSATLGAAARGRLLSPLKRRKAKPPALAAAIATPYPALSHASADGPSLRAAAGRGIGKVAHVEPHAVIDRPQDIAALALAAAERGAKVLVVRNLVRDAVATLAALEDLAGDHPALFRVDGVRTLHHGRFARTDRRILDQAVETGIGKVRPDGPLVLVGTQTLEQSLDIDADLLVTDLAPIDVLLQRIGRLHRHARARPEGFGLPRVVVLVPESLDGALAAASGGGRGAPHGLGGFVYENVLSVAATRRLIGAGARWEIPAENRRLVELGTHPEALEALARELARDDPRWLTALGDAAGRDFARRSAGGHAVIDWREPVPHFRVEADEHLGTRLGLADREVMLPDPLAGPFASSARIDRLVIASHLAADAPADAVATDVVATAGGFSFRLGARRFRYDRFGLRPVPGEGA